MSTRPLDCSARSLWGIQWLQVGGLGRIYERRKGRFAIRFFSGGKEYYVGSVPVGESDMPLESKELAERVLEHIRALVASGKSLDVAFEPFVRKSLPANHVIKRMWEWHAYLERLVTLGDRSANYPKRIGVALRAKDSHFAFWEGVSVFSLTPGGVEDWSLAMAERGLKPKTRKILLGYLHSMLRWMHRRGDLDRIPPFPETPQDEYRPTIVSADVQQKILDAIPWERRGVFLACSPGLRPSEARALDLSDYRNGLLRVNKAVQGKALDSPIGPTKNRRQRELPIDERLGQWLAWRKAQAQSPSEPLFLNDKTRKRWAQSAMNDAWNRACVEIGIQVGLYEGTKHSFASDRLRRGISTDELQTYLGHRDRRSTERYAELDSGALVHLVR